MLKFILVFILVMSVIRVVSEAVRLGICFYKVTPFKASKWDNALTASALSYIITVMICGLCL